MKAGRKFQLDSGESIARRPRNIGWNILKRVSMYREYGSVLVFSKTQLKSMSGRKWRPLKSSRRKREDKEVENPDNHIRMDSRDAASPDMLTSQLKRNPRRLSRRRTLQMK